jgi:hypothetical protein
LYQIQVESKSDPHVIAHLNAIRAPGASVWLTTMPYQAVHTLTDLEFHVASCVRAYKCIDPTFQLAHPTCPNCGFSTQNNKLHWISCSATQSARTKAHHRINARGVLLAIQEQHVLAHTTREYTLAGTSLRVDALITRVPSTDAIDVKIVDPLCNSHVEGAACQIFHAGKKAVQEKIDKYAVPCQLSGFRFIPIVMESTGGIAHEALNWLADISRDSDVYDANTVKYRLIRTLSFELIRGNARILQEWLLAARTPHQLPAARGRRSVRG